MAIKAFIRHDHKILVLRQSSDYEDGTQVGKYEIPGGRLDVGEPWKEGFSREIKEETGLDVSDGKPFFIDEWWPEVRGEKWHIIGTYLLCEVDSDEVILSQDHDDFLWIDPKQYDSLPLVAGTEKAFEAYLTHAGSGGTPVHC